MEIPVLIIAFRRADRLGALLAELRLLRPKKLFVAIDGGRNSKEWEAVRKCQCLIRSMIDWDCALHVRFAERNAGCFEWVSSAVSWFFEHVEFGAVLEEDLVVDAGFFQFVDKCRVDFRSDRRVMHINGFNPIGSSSGRIQLSHFVCSWGWATWADRWRHYDKEMNSWSACSSIERLRHIHRYTYADVRLSFYFYVAIMMTLQGKYSSWAYRWNWSVWRMGGSSVVPPVNLVENHGVGEGAQHTSKSDFLNSFKIQTFNDVPGRLIAVPGEDVERMLSVSEARSCFKLLRMAGSSVVPGSVFRSVRRKFR